MTRGKQRPDSIAVLARHQYHRQPLQLSRDSIGVTVKNVMVASGDEGYRLRLPFRGRVDGRRSLGVFGKQIIPRLEYDAVYQNELHGNVPRFLQVCLSSFSHVQDRNWL